jgi:hypothetical protein
MKLAPNYFSFLVFALKRYIVIKFVNCNIAGVKYRMLAYSVAVFKDIMYSLYLPKM